MPPTAKCPKALIPPSGPNRQALNALISQYAKDNGILYVDYYSEMDEGDGGLKQGLSNDEVHPNDKGYEIIERIVLGALKIKK